MSDTVRGVAILLSVLLWSPVAPSLLRGEVGAEKALLLYVAALLLALTGCTLLSGLLNAYAAVPVDDADRAGEVSEPVVPAGAERRGGTDPAG